MNKQHIAVIYGGASTEHEVSCRSAYTILTHMPKELTVAAIGITKKGEWFEFFGDYEKIPTGEWEFSDEKKAIAVSDLKADCVLPVLHGKNGEDGTIQGLFELLNMKYAGCGVCASAVSMDKSMTKLLVSTAGIRQADFVLVDKYNKNDIAGLVAETEQKLGYPVFVKPCRFGSSVGVSKASDRASLEKGLREALKFDDRILIEEGIDARELECAVLETENGLVSEVGEVVSAIEFYDYDAKYNNPDSMTVLTPDISPEIEEEIKEKARRIFRLLNCKGLSRVDFFLDRETGEIVFNEINTLPGFTSISMFPMLMKKHGLEIEDIIRALIK